MHTIIFLNSFQIYPELCRKTASCIATLLGKPVKVAAPNAYRDVERGLQCQ
ncbi:MAG: hypothetical protein HY935_04010 [Nitrosomonadales bacterium]|nr:hypothetical protein [Nitrosomonadales bacterium]